MKLFVKEWSSIERLFIPCRHSLKEIDQSCDIAYYKVDAIKPLYVSKVYHFITYSDKLRINIK
jgi:hypothetical protein